MSAPLSFFAHTAGGELNPWAMIAVALVVFLIGLLGILVRRNLIVMIMCVELMLNAVNLCFVAFSKLHQSLQGETIVMFVMTVAAAESAVGLGLIIAAFRTLRSIDSGAVSLLRD